MNDIDRDHRVSKKLDRQILAMRSHDKELAKSASHEQKGTRPMASKKTQPVRIAPDRGGKPHHGEPKIDHGKPGEIPTRKAPPDNPYKNNPKPR